MERGLLVINSFDADHPEMTLGEVARRTDLTRPAARRFLLTLVGLGYVRANDRLYSLTPRVLQLGHAYLSSIRLPDVARPHLEDFGKAHTESCSLAILDGHDVVLVANANARRLLVVAYTVGSRFPWYATSLGRVLVAFAPEEVREAYLSSTVIKPLRATTVSDRASLAAMLEKVRTNGYALIDEELEEGVKAVAVPVRNRFGDVVAALNVSAASRTRAADHLVEQLLDPLKRTAREIEADLIGLPTWPGTLYKPLD